MNFAVGKQSNDILLLRTFGDVNSNSHDFILKLGNTKSADGKITLVHFLAEVVEEKFPNIAGWELDLSHIEQASKCMLSSPSFVDVKPVSLLLEAKTFVL